MHPESPIERGRPPDVPPERSPRAQQEAEGNPLLMHLQAAGLIIAAIVVTFWWVISDRNDAKFLGAGDAWQYAGPNLFYMDDRLHHGELPLWNPLIMCGQPHAGNPQAFLFYPPNLLRSLLTFHPTPWKTHVGVTVMVFLHLVLGGVGAYLFARHHKLGLGASLVAAFAYVLSAPSVSRAVGHWYFYNMLAWLPLLLWLVRLTLEAEAMRRKMRFALAAGIVYGITILGGSPHFMMLFPFVIAWYWVLYRSLNRKKTWRETGATALRDLSALTLCGIVGVLIALPLLLPAIEFSHFSIRAIDKNADMRMADLEQPPWNVFQLLATYSGNLNYEGIKAAGAIVLLFALFSVVRIRRRDLLLYGLLFLIVLDCSVKHSLFFGRLLTSLSPYKMAEPGRAMLIGCLPLGILAGMGVDAALSPLRSKRLNVLRSLALLLLGGVVLAALLRTAHPHPFLQVSSWVIILPALACLAAVAGGWLVEPLLWGVVIAMLAFGETQAWNRCFLPHVIAPSLRYPYPLNTLENSAKFWSDNRRGTDALPNLNMYHLRPAINGYDPLVIEPVRLLLCSPSCEDTYYRVVWFWEVTSANFRGLLFLKRPFWLAKQYVVGPLPGKNELFPPTTTVFLSDPIDAPVPRVERDAVPNSAVSDQAVLSPVVAHDAQPVELSVSRTESNEPVFTSSLIRLPRSHSALRMTFLSDCVADIEVAFQDPTRKRMELGRKLRINAGGQEQPFEMPLPDFEEFQVGLLPRFVEKEGTIRLVEMSVLCDPADEDGLIRVVSRTANTVEVEVGPLPGSRILAFFDADYPGWEATVDNAPVPILRANEQFKAVVVPTGTHSIRFAFTSWRVYLGLLVSAITLVMACAEIVRLSRLRDRETS